MIRTLTSAALALALVSGFSNSASAAAVKLRVLGWYGNQKQSTDIERPFWKDLEKNTKEQVAADFRTIDEIGLKGFESMRTLRVARDALRCANRAGIQPAMSRTRNPVDEAST